jgi:hypothetical protein
MDRMNHWSNAINAVIKCERDLIREKVVPSDLDFRRVFHDSINEALTKTCRKEPNDLS